MQKENILLHYYKALGRLTTTLNKIHQEGNFMKANEVINNAFSEYINISLSEITEITESDFLDSIEKHQLNLGQLHILVELLFQKAQFESEEGTLQESIINYKKAMTILGLLEKEELMLSI